MAGPGVVNIVKPGSAYSGMIQITDAEARLIDDARRDDDLVLAALRRTTSSIQHAAITIAIAIDRVILT
jgi:hypothetical protein